MWDFTHRRKKSIFFHVAPCAILSEKNPEKLRHRSSIKGWYTLIIIVTKKELNAISLLHYSEFHSLAQFKCCHSEAKVKKNRINKVYVVFTD